MKKTDPVFRPDDEQMQLLERWFAPTVETARQQNSGNNAVGVAPEQVAAAAKARQQQAEAPEPEPEEPTLTAQDLEEIRQSAYDEGFAEGRQKGTEQGLLEGHEQGYEQGVAQGREDGLAQGLASGEEQVQATIATLTTLLDSLNAPLQQQDERLEQELLSLALVLAKSVIHQEVEQNPQAVIKAVSEGIKSLGAEQGQVRVMLNPDDLPAVQQAWGEEELAKRQWLLMAEPSLARGGCQIETATSSVDMTLEQRIKSVFDHFNAMPAPELADEPENTP